MDTHATTPRELCGEVKSVCQGEFRKLCARPWNRFDPDNHLWWLVPSTDWPAYRYGKLFFDWVEPSDPTVISCGLHVERGLDLRLESVYSSRSGSAYLMRNDWEWPRFLSDLKDGRVAAAVDELKDVADSITVGVESSYAQDPGSFDPYSDVLWRAREKREFASVRGALTKLDEWMSDPWRWIDLWIAIPLRVQVGASSGAAVTPAELWTRYLSRFRPWLGAG